MILKKPDFILILDTHPVEDGRIQKHIRFLLDNNYPLFHIHITPYQSDSGLSDGEYSILGEKSYNINLKWKMNKKGLRLLNYLSYFHPALEKKILAVIEHWGIISSSHGIIHIHDPVLLPLGKKIRAHYFTRCVIVYDRHEIYEGMKRFAGISGYRLFEMVARKDVKGVIIVSEYHKRSAGTTFPRTLLVTVQNYPLVALFDQKLIRLKIDSFSKESEIICSYIGSLRNDYDRDITLLLDVSQSLLEKNPRVKVIIGGSCNDGKIQKRFLELSSHFSIRFQYLGQVPYSTVVEITQKSHFGFYFLKNRKIDEIGSPNKIYEYLFCGTIPVIKGNIDCRDTITSCSHLCSDTEKGEQISTKIEQIISNNDLMKEMMRSAFTLGQQFTWEHVASRYLSLYEVLLASNNKISK